MRRTLIVIGVGLDLGDVRLLGRIGLGREPGVEHLVRDLRAREPQAHHKHVGVIPTASTRGGLRIGAQCSPDAPHLVRRDRRTGPRPAEQHTAVSLSPRDDVTNPAADGGPGQIVSRRGPDQGDVGAARSEIRGNRLGQLGLLVGTQDDSHGLRCYVRSCPRMGWWRHPLIRILAAVVAVVAVALAADAAGADLTVAALLLLVTVLAVGTLGYPAGIAGAVVGFLVLNWFFTEPTGSLKISHADDVVALIVFTAATALVGWIVHRLAILRRQAQQREQEAEIRLDLTNRLLAGDDLDDSLAQAATALRDSFGFESCTLIAGPPPAEDGSVNVRVEGQGVTLLAHTETDITPADRALLQALVAGLATAVDRLRLQQEVRETKLVAELGRQRAGFLSAVSHNLRTPLTAVKAAAGALLASWSRIDAEERRELLETISDEAERLERLVRNTLELSRIRAGALEVDREPVDIAGLVQHAVRRLRPIARAHRVRLDVSDDLPLVMLDVTMLEQILLNLLENALRFAPPGSEIGVSARAVGDELELRVADHGPGVPPEARERIFLEFQSADDRPDTPGTGLGLAIVRALVLAQGGTVRYEDTPGGGATFVCTFPREIEDR